MCAQYERIVRSNRFSRERRGTNRESRRFVFKARATEEFFLRLKILVHFYERKKRRFSRSILVLTLSLFFYSKRGTHAQVGLDAAGKTTILYKLKLGEIVTTIPTIGTLSVFLLRVFTTNGFFSSRFFCLLLRVALKIGIERTRTRKSSRPLVFFRL